jgi:hypothetical protein
MSQTGTEARVCEDIARRQQLGIKKYGVTVEENMLSTQNGYNMRMKRRWISPST